MKTHIKNYFITGLLATIPITVTVYILKVFISMVDSVLTYLPIRFHPDTYLPFHVPGLGLIATVVMVFIVGVLTQSLVGRKLIPIGEWVVSKIPVARNIYLAVKQLVEAIFAQNSKGFKRVVLVEFPRKDIWSLGFLTGVVEGEIQDKTKESVVSVFIPTVPNPTTGFYLMVPKKDVISLDMTVEDAFKLAMSGGIVTPSRKANHNSQISKIGSSG